MLSEPIGVSVEDVQHDLERVSLLDRGYYQHRLFLRG